MQELKEVLNDDARIRAWQQLPIEVRVEAALQLVSAFELLQRMNFIHADMKPEALFVGRGTSPGCAIIDFDSGVVVKNATDAPTTIGTKQPWLAPEIMAQMGGATAQQVAVTLASDLWSVAVAVHVLLLSVHPHFFLSETCPSVMEDYNRRFQWPACDASLPAYKAELTATHTQVITYAKSQLPLILAAFSATFGPGYSSIPRRTSFASWRFLLQRMQRSEIISFSADRNRVDDTHPVRLTWTTAGPGKLELVGIGDVTGRMSYEVVVRLDREFELRLTPPLGTPVSRRVTVMVDRTPPVIDSFTSNNSLLDRSPLAMLQWRVRGAERVELDQGLGNMTRVDRCDVSVRKDTTFTLRAISSFGAVATASVTIKVSKIAPKIHFLKAEPEELAGPGPVKLRWLVSGGAESVSITGVGEVSRRGIVEIRPTTDTIYTLIATSPFGYKTIQRVAVSLSRKPPVIERFQATPQLTDGHTPITLSWHVRGAVSVEIEPKIGVVRLRGSMQVPGSPETVYRLRARSFGGAEVTRAVRVNLLPVSRMAHIPSVLSANTAGYIAVTLQKTSGKPAGSVFVPASPACLTSTSYKEAV
jgi:hypothetical protein